MANLKGPRLHGVTLSQSKAGHTHTHEKEANNLHRDEVIFADYLGGSSLRSSGPIDLDL